LQHGDAENQAVDRWYLACTQLSQETVVLANLDHQGAQAYWPLVEKFKKLEQDSLARFESMFPRDT
jgi:transcriptional antiterminator RfaH